MIFHSYISLPEGIPHFKRVNPFPPPFCYGTPAQAVHLTQSGQHQMRVAQGARRNFILLGETDASWSEPKRDVGSGAGTGCGATLSKWELYPQFYYVYIYICICICILCIYVCIYIYIWNITTYIWDFRGYIYIYIHIWIINHLLSGMHIQVGSQTPPKKEHIL